MGHEFENTWGSAQGYESGWDQDASANQPSIYPSSPDQCSSWHFAFCILHFVIFCFGSPSFNRIFQYKNDATRQPMTFPEQSNARPVWFTWYLVRHAVTIIHGSLQRLKCQRLGALLLHMYRIHVCRQWRHAIGQPGFPIQISESKQSRKPASDA